MNCSICLGILKEPVSIPCGHIYCSICIANYVNSASDDEEEAMPLSTCPTCRSPFTLFTPDLSLLSRKYRPYVLPGIRRIYIDNTPYQELQRKLREAEKRIKTLENTKQELLRECERHMAVSNAHAEGEHQARMDLTAAQEESIEFQDAAQQWEAEAENLRESLAMVTEEKDSLRKKWERGRVAADRRQAEAEKREAELVKMIQDMSVQCRGLAMQATSKGSSSPTEARRKRKILVADGASSDVSSQSRGASPRRVSYPSDDDPSVRPAKRPRKPLPRRSVGSAEPLWAYSEEDDDPPPSFRGRGIKAEDNY
ncbi:hypothetical protein AB1N83_004858 [Pleurotus pulmonarius]